MFLHIRIAWLLMIFMIFSDTSFGIENCMFGHRFRFHVRSILAHFSMFCRYRVLNEFLIRLFIIAVGPKWRALGDPCPKAAWARHHDITISRYHDIPLAPAGDHEIMISRNHDIPLGPAGDHDITISRHHGILWQKRVRSRYHDITKS